MRRFSTSWMLMWLALGPLTTPVRALRPPRPAVLPSPALEAAHRAGGVTTLAPAFAPWFQRALAVARRSWRMPVVTNLYGEKVTEESFLKAIVFIESAGIHARPGRLTKSAVGAMGFMQLMPGTARDLGADAQDPEENLMGGVKYLGYCFKSPGTRVSKDSAADRLAKVAAAYNSGPGRKNLLVPWSDYVGRGYKETTGYGIKLKMALGLPMSTKEKTWIAAQHKQKVAWVEQYARTIYAHAHGLVRPPPLIPPGSAAPGVQLAATAD